MSLRRSSYWNANRNLPYAICAASLAALLLTGCTKENGNTAPPPSGGNAPTNPTANTGAKKKVLFVFKVGGISYSEACRAGAQQANDDPALNAEVKYQAPTIASADQQGQIIDQAIVNHVDAIVVSPNDAGAIVPVIHKATQAGIQVFTWDSDAPASDRKFYVAATDDVQIGADIFSALAKSIDDKGDVLIFSGGQTAENLNKHLEGIAQEAKKHPNVHILQPINYNNDDKSLATQMATAKLTQYPNVAGIACVNSPSPAAAGQALRTTHRVGKVKVWGLGLPSENKPYLQDGSVTGLYLWDPQKLTYLTAKLVIDALNGKHPINGQAIPGETGTVTVNGPTVTLPLRLEINKQNVDRLKF